MTIYTFCVSLPLQKVQIVQENPMEGGVEEIVSGGSDSDCSLPVAKAPNQEYLANIHYKFIGKIIKGFFLIIGSGNNIIKAIAHSGHQL